MIVATLYDEKNEMIKEKVDKLKEYTITSDYLKEYTFKYINKINANSRYIKKHINNVQFLLFAIFKHFSELSGYFIKIAIYE